MSKPVILTGLRANNELHIGNYFGALLPIVDMAKNKSKDYQINLFVPDLHSFTTPIDHMKLHEQIRGALKMFVAAGLPLDDQDVHIYRQSHIPAHCELTVILNSFTGMGEMERMTQYKDKSSKLGTDRISVGLFDYPVLMAADILLYGAKYVPVGDDQSQHIEFARDIADRLNKKFSQKLFALPEPVSRQHDFFGKDQGLRIKDLQSPDKKMSKSDESSKGIIFLTDKPEEAHHKIMSATTDNEAQVKYDPEKQPGIANLLQIYGLLKEKTIEEAAQEFTGQSQYGEFKKVIADAVANFLYEFQDRLGEVDLSALDNKLNASEELMNEVANDRLLRVQKAIGLR